MLDNHRSTLIVIITVKRQLNYIWWAIISDKDNIKILCRDVVIIFMIGVYIKVIQFGNVFTFGNNADKAFRTIRR